MEVTYEMINAQKYIKEFIELKLKEVELEEQRKEVLKDFQDIKDKIKEIDKLTNFQEDKYIKNNSDKVKLFLKIVADDLKLNNSKYLEIEYIQKRDDSTKKFYLKEKGAYFQNSVNKIENNYKLWGYLIEKEDYYATDLLEKIKFRCSEETKKKVDLFIKIATKKRFEFQKTKNSTNETKYKIWINEELTEIKLIEIRQNDNYIVLSCQGINKIYEIEINRSLNVTEFMALMSWRKEMISFLNESIRELTEINKK